ncbi:PQQ-dependent sugar dehydrogenase, partial [Pseudomonas viridiflava]|uniref:PQQ-dependent sugar dehydrogenase n=1 Tax=Pseudomonas viridiflava TaxID=33069 RepID=UPI0013D380AC
FIGALATEELIRLKFEGDKIVQEERLLKDMKQRIRDVRHGPDGYLYLLTHDSKGQLLKIGLAE